MLERRWTGLSREQSTCDVLCDWSECTSLDDAIDMGSGRMRGAVIDNSVPSALGMKAESRR